METLAILLDITLVIAGLAAYRASPKIGGELAKGLRLLTNGVLILGFAHLVESLMFVYFDTARPFNEVIHRLIVILGFTFVIVGFNRMRGAFGR
jgi:hypothetical protein